MTFDKQNEDLEDREQVSSTLEHFEGSAGFI